MTITITTTTFTLIGGLSKELQVSFRGIPNGMSSHEQLEINEIGNLLRYIVSKSNRLLIVSQVYAHINVLIVSA